MFSNLKKMVQENKFSTIIFYMPENTKIEMERKKDKYTVLFVIPSEFKEFEITENEFFKYLENAMKSICFSGKYKITNNNKLTSVCSFTVDYNN